VHQVGNNIQSIHDAWSEKHQVINITFGIILQLHYFKYNFLISLSTTTTSCRANGGAVGWGTAPSPVMGLLYLLPPYAAWCHIVLSERYQHLEESYYLHLRADDFSIHKYQTRVWPELPVFQVSEFKTDVWKYADTWKWTHPKHSAGGGSVNLQSGTRDMQFGPVSHGRATYKHLCELWPFQLPIFVCVDMLTYYHVLQ